MKLRLALPTALAVVALLALAPAVGAAEAPRTVDEVLACGAVDATVAPAGEAPETNLDLFAPDPTNQATSSCIDGCNSWYGGYCLTGECGNLTVGQCSNYRLQCYQCCNKFGVACLPC